MSERSQSILNYPLKPEYPANLLYTYKKEISDDDLTDKIVMSKKQYKFEDNFMTEEELKIKKFNELALGQDKGFVDYLEKIDPIDKDFNYFKIQKLSHEFVHEHIQFQTIKFQNTSEVLKVFVKKNEHINFFLSDFDGIQAGEIDVIKEEKKRLNAKNNNNQNEVQDKQILMAISDTHSQGKSFFFVQKNQDYELVKAYPDNIYIEIRNKENPEQIGIFKWKDFNGPVLINHERDAKLQLSTNSSNILNIHDDRMLKETQLTDMDDHSEISTRSKKFSISMPNNVRKRSYSSKKINISNVMNTPMKTSQNLKQSQMSTAATRRY